jgi:hypothetical protein
MSLITDSVASDDIFVKIPIKTFAECPSFPGWTACSDGSVWYQAKAMPYNLSNSGYVQVHSYENGQKKMRYVHQLISDAFLGTCPEGMSVDHISGDKTDNRLSNLRYLSKSDQIKTRPLAKKHVPCSQDEIVGEIWMPLTHNELLTGYFISNQGRARTPTGKITVGSKMHNHLELTVNRNGSKFHEAMHLLVAKAFLLDEWGLDLPFDVFHLDYNKFNNALDNLVLVNPGEKTQMTKILKKDIAEADAKRRKTSQSPSYSSSSSENSE